MSHNEKSMNLASNRPCFQNKEKEVKIGTNIDKVVGVDAGI